MPHDVVGVKGLEAVVRQAVCVCVVSVVGEAPGHKRGKASVPAPAVEPQRPVQHRTGGQERSVWVLVIVLSSQGQIVDIGHGVALIDIKPGLQSQIAYDPGVYGEMSGMKIFSGVVAVFYISVAQRGDD